MRIVVLCDLYLETPYLSNKSVGSRRSGFRVQGSGFSGFRGWLIELLSAGVVARKPIIAAAAYSDAGADRAYLLDILFS